MSCMRLLAASLVTLAVGCGGTAIIDPDDGSGGTGADDDDGSGAGTPTGTATGTATGTTTGTPTGQPFDPDGIAEPLGASWRFRVASFDLDCASKDAPAPFSMCGWWDIDIILNIDQLVDDFVVTPDSGIGSSSFSSTEPGSSPGGCPGAGGGGSLFGTVTIVDVQDDRVTIELGQEWSLVALDPSLDPSGLHTLARCD